MSYTQPGTYGQQQEPGLGPVTGRGPSGPRAGFWRRFAAALLDGIIVGIAFGILYAALKGVGYALGILIGIAYFVYFEGGPTGQTLGKKALGIRVIDFATGGPIGHGRAFIRYIGRIASEIPILLGYFWMLWDKEKQTWHDKFAGSVVVPVADYPLPYV
jgi:uncharacterized RDD family membrane protein YckC